MSRGRLIGTRSLCRRDRHFHNLGSFRIGSRVFHILRIADDAILGGAGIGRFLPRSLVGADAGFLIDFRAGIPENHLRCDISADTPAVLEQIDAGFRRSVEPVIGLAHHRRQR